MSSAQPCSLSRYFTPSHVLSDGLREAIRQLLLALREHVDGEVIGCSGTPSSRLDQFDRQNSTSGGSSDTEVNEFTVTPVCWPSGVRAVMIVTPVV